MPKTRANKKRIATDGPEPATGKSKKTKNGDLVQCVTDRVELLRLWEPNSSCFKIISWNVNGIRALLKNQPSSLQDLLISQNYPNVICLQETKLQEAHIDDKKLQLRGLLKDEGYESYWSCSTAKKGYAGTAVFIRTHEKVRDEEEDRAGIRSQKKKGSLDSFLGIKSRASEEKAESSFSLVPLSNSQFISTEEVQFGLCKSKHDKEGRAITTHFPSFSLASLYVPNSGQKLERLDYRTQEWDVDLLNYMRDIESRRGVPVIWLGDLNVAHKRLDIYNDGAKHLLKQAGCTLKEKESFSRQLEAGYVDAFRELHPDAGGQYTYWSQRTFAREPNKGLRLDYFVCSKTMMKEDNDHAVVRDSYMIRNDAQRRYIWDLTSISS